eukprot:scaffold126832_cov16-Tisochrysis_lutea.AAC.2
MEVVISRSVKEASGSPVPQDCVCIVWYCVVANMCKQGLEMARLRSQSGIITTQMAPFHVSSYSCAFSTCASCLSTGLP